MHTLPLTLQPLLPGRARSSRLAPFSWPRGI